MTTSLAELQGTNFRTSRAADDINSKLLQKLGVKNRYEPARIAIARSLSISDSPGPIDDEDDEGGKVIKGEQLFGVGADLAAWISLLVEHAELTDATKKDVQEQVRRHWHRGAMLLWTEWQECKEDFDKFVVQLAERAGVREGQRDGIGASLGGARIPGVPIPIQVRLGEIGIIEETGDTAEWILNLDGRSPHLGIFGKTRKGKTRTAKSILEQVAGQGVPLLIIDPKGDLRQDEGFIARIGATSISVGREPIPLDALRPVDGADQSVIRVADGFVEAVSKAVTSMGAKQQDSLRDVTKRAIANGHQLDMVTIVQAVDARYKQNRQRADVLTAALHKIQDYRLFQPELSPEEFFQKSWVLSLNDIQDEAMRFTLLFLLDALLRHLRAAPDSSVDRKQGIREIKLLLAVDEARRIVELASSTMLEGLVLECSSKGLSCMFISQSPDHLDRASDDIIRQFEVAATFEADLSQKSARRVLGQSATPVAVQQLEIGTCLARLPGYDEPVVIRAWEPSSIPDETE